MQKKGMAKEASIQQKGEYKQGNTVWINRY
jgi:hypothetical protein